MVSERASSALLHRHIGGLESMANCRIINPKLHRHIGGLEITSLVSGMGNVLHRHIGGLESDDDEYRQEFNENVGCFDDEVQLSILKSKVIKYPVTSIMNDAQMSEYLSMVKNFLTFDCGIDLDEGLHYEQT